MPQTPRLFAYIDETGDRGLSQTASPIFGMACVLVDEQGAVALREAVETLRADFNVPEGVVMSWKNHAKTHDLRRRAAHVLCNVEGLKVLYVYVKKSELRDGSYGGSPQTFYNYVAFKMYKSILWAARNWKGRDAQLWTRYGHVRNHDHRTTKAYIQQEVAADSRLPGHIEQGLQWVSADRYLESQAADLFGGFLKAAVWPEGRFGYVEPAYLLSIWPLLRNSEACAIPLGIMSMPDYKILTSEDWFPCKNCTK